MPGGGVALIRAQKALELESSKGANGTRPSASASRRADRGAAAPDRRERRRDAAVVVAEQGRRWQKGTYGYNAGTGEYGDMLDMGILDPTKVTRLALQNAASVAGLLLTTEVMVAEAEGRGAKHGGGMPDMGDMGGNIRDRRERPGGSHTAVGEGIVAVPGDGVGAAHGAPGRRHARRPAGRQSIRLPDERQAGRWPVRPERFSVSGEFSLPQGQKPAPAPPGRRLTGGEIEACCPTIGP